MALPVTCQGDYADEKNGVMLTLKEKKSEKKGAAAKYLDASKLEGLHSNLKLKVR